MNILYHLLLYVELVLLNLLHLFHLMMVFFLFYFEFVIYLLVIHLIILFHFLYLMLMELLYKNIKKYSEFHIVSKIIFVFDILFPNLNNKHLSLSIL